MKSRPKTIVFENLAVAHGAAVLAYVLAEYRVLFLRSNWKGAARIARRLVLKEPLYLRSNPAGDKAFVFTDSLYETVFQQDPLVARMQALYEDERIHWVFKKYLNMLLEQYFHYLYLGERIRDSLPEVTEILFVPERAASGSLPPVTGANLPPWNLPFLKGEGWKRMTPPFSFKIPWWVRARGRVLEVLDLVQTFFETLALFLWKFFAGLRGAEAPSSYPFAIAIITPAREFANPFRAYDVLLDGDKIRKDNTLFVPAAPLTPAQRRTLASKGLALAETSCGISWALMGRLIRLGLSLARELPAAPWWVARVSVYLWRDYGIWKSFLERYNIRHFVSYNEYSFRPVARNLLLNRQGVQTWYYADTINTSSIYLLRPGQPPYRQSIWGYLFYDHFISWSKSLSEYHQKHGQHIAQYHHVGCLWAEHICLLKEGRLPSRLRDRFSRQSAASGRKIVAVFDSSYHPDSITNYEDGIAFAEGIERLLEEMPDLYVIWKEKKPRHALRQLSWDQDRAYQKLSRHSRLFFCGSDVAPAEVLALCDLAISFPFTSVTVEALAARVKALYYDPRNKIYGSYDTQIPGLVTHGFEQLKRRVQELADMNPETYRHYLDQHVLGVLDPYLDGKALSRFRDLLSQGQVPADKTAGKIAHETALLSR